MEEGKRCSRECFPNLKLSAYIMSKRKGAVMEMIKSTLCPGHREGWNTAGLSESLSKGGRSHAENISDGLETQAPKSS